MKHQAKNAAPNHGKQRFSKQQTDCSGFTPRQKIALEFLLHGPMHREAIDRACGASNGPALIMSIRRLGFEIPCERVPKIDRYGQPCQPGIYFLTSADRAKLGGSSCV